MQSRKSMKEEITKLNSRVYELEELLCPCGQHQFVKVDSRFITTCCAPVIDGYSENKLKCLRCKKVVYDGSPFGNIYEHLIKNEGSDNSFEDILAGKGISEYPNNDNDGIIYE